MIPVREVRDTATVASPGLPPVAKRRKRTTACDICKHKKIRCDGGQPGRRCVQCSDYNRECTYEEATSASDKVLSKTYITKLETRIERLEQLLSKSICPRCGSSTAAHSSESDTLLRGINPFEQVSHSLDEQQSSTQTPSDSTSDDLEASDDEVSNHCSLIQNIRGTHLNHEPVRFLGKSSNANLLRDVFNTKGEPYVEGDPHLPHGRYHRPQFWNSHPWLRSDARGGFHLYGPEAFPEPDLMHTLIDLYFIQLNTYMPLLHRPTFEAEISDGLHLRDPKFGATVLVVCAVGARFSEDPRVYLEGYEDDPLSRGWKWFNSVQTIQQPWLCLPNLYHVQLCCLMIQFLESTSAFQASWMLIGIGIRMAQDVGAHERGMYTGQHRAEEELWKRAFWILVVMDRAISAITGRPCAMQDEDFDLDLLTECDDEYWMNPDPDLAFKQPPGKPSTIAFFNCLIRLTQILAFAQRTIYSGKKLKTLMGIGPEWEEKIVRELDSALNRWLDTIPEHLRWDPNQEDPIFMNQSAHLFVNHNQIQIFIHRPYMQSPNKPTFQTFPSLAICTNAARASIHALDIQYKRTGFLLFSVQTSLFTSAIVLLLNVWGSRRSGRPVNLAKEIEDVQKCIDIQKIAEKHWYFCGRGRDILHELAYVGDLPPLTQSPFPSRKRDQEGAVIEDRNPADGHSSFLNPAPVRSDDGHSSQMPSVTVSCPRVDLANDRQLAPNSQNDSEEEFQQTNFVTTAADHRNLLGQNGFGLSPDPLVPSFWQAHNDELDNLTFPSTSDSTTAMGDANANAHQPSYPVDSNRIPDRQAGGAFWPMSPTNDDTLAMLMSMPMGFEWNDWDAYLNVMSDMNDTTSAGTS
ncbi:hypothetical protein WOLCODRAFT_115748 [Wolfiporia cocos MD-104 SS10]|uniref:Zn(2)-C6 fungal-type domain-containing protein n=1 Tax=Wolfiporia cocos (strain MD-104) TaxID=742152 RepID=A0A2H3J8M8_WOLCO|nr:hypothetical protein WOLCODRAFT_115748 [Wolfiporia cocos MD-104 SS10]